MQTQVVNIQKIVLKNFRDVGKGIFAATSTLGGARLLFLSWRCHGRLVFHPRDKPGHIPPGRSRGTKQEQVADWLTGTCQGKLKKLLVRQPVDWGGLQVL